MESCRATLYRANTAIAPFPSAPKPYSAAARDFRRNRVVCVRSSSSDLKPKENQMIISITGATGFIGRRLVEKLIAGDHKVYVLTRFRTKAQSVFPAVNFPEIIVAEEEEWAKCIQASNAVVNLAGMPISTRWSSEIKKEIKQSRSRITSKVVNLINNTNAEDRPSVFVSATAVGYYGTSETEIFDETSPSGNDYLSEMASSSSSDASSSSRPYLCFKSIVCSGCGRKASVRVSETVRNPGRLFYSCSCGVRWLGWCEPKFLLEEELALPLQTR